MSEREHSVAHGTAGDAGVGHERSDLEPRTIAIFGLALVVVVAGCLIVAAWMFGFFAASRAQEDVPPSPLARVEPPAGPVLQVNAPNDRARLRAEEDSILSTYAWVDRGAGIVRIPIGQAMQLLAERGLPAAAGKSEPAKAKGR
ncbi:MAG: hypothetical protein ACHQ7N_11410 [Candidatus Methylomirabilales bacterium]